MRMISTIKDQRGVSAIEFAIVLPILILLIFGIIEFSLFLYDKAVITNASREGARAGIVFADPRIDDASIEAVVDNYCQNNVITFGAATGPTTTVTRGGTGSAGDPLTVRVTYQYDFLVIPNYVPRLGSGVGLVGETIMRLE
jgi:Flp pilus assembly protein TadG